MRLRCMHKHTNTRLNWILKDFKFWSSEPFEMLAAHRPSDSAKQVKESSSWSSSNEEGAGNSLDACFCSNNLLFCFSLQYWSVLKTHFVSQNFYCHIWKSMKELTSLGDFKLPFPLPALLGNDWWCIKRSRYREDVKKYYLPGKRYR